MKIVNSIKTTRSKVAGFLMLAVVCAVLSLGCIINPTFPAGETISQWCWFDKIALWALGCILFSFLVWFKNDSLNFSFAVSWSLIILGCIEAVWGIRQLYGYAASNHSLYALTGSFFNPGPYSGYLAMILPVCLHQYLQKKGEEAQWLYKTKKYMAGVVLLLILCVFPAGMSRSAWLAAGFSCLWVYACHVQWVRYIQEAWWLHRRKLIMSVIGILCAIILIGLLFFNLKPDSAKGRVFMWKISCHAIAERPLFGHGIGNFAAAYGHAQEAYFASGDYTSWEEVVAGSPEYAFNEYLQLAVEFGVPLTFGLLAVVVVCLFMGVQKERYGVCGAIFSLMIFSFSSYPLQLPVFIVTFGGLLLACILENSRWEWLSLAILVGAIGGFRLKNDMKTEQACRDWMNAKVLYNVGAYKSAEEDYARLYPLLKDRAAFLFEYGHGLHKQQKYEASNRILKEALKRSSDPMILNILGKNSQQSGDYLAAEDWFIRSTHRLPGRIYPYYLLAKLYAEPGFSQPEKFEEMKRIVLTKEPKVNSTAIRQMREEVSNMKPFTPFL